MLSVWAARRVSVITVMLMRMSCGFSRSQSLIPMMPRTSKSLMMTLSMCLLDQMTAAIHVDDLAGDVRGPREQEEQRSFNLGQLAPARGRHGLQDAFVVSCRLVG